MTAHAAPIQFGSTQGDLGFAYVFAAQEILQELQEELDVLGLGLVTLYGDLSASGSDVVRITRMTGAGWAEAFQTMTSEVDPIIASGFTSNFDTLTIARHGLAKEETYQQAVLNREAGVSLAALKAKVPQSWLKTLRQKLTAAGAGITASTGNVALAWDFDDELDMLAAFHETEGFGGEIITMRHPEQFTDLRDAIRDEPSYQTPEVMNEIMGLKAGGGSFNFLGVKNFSSFDVQQASGGHQGFAYAPGGIGWVVASSAPIRTANPATTMYIPQFGMVIEDKSEGKTATGRYDANSWFGVGKLDPTIFPQRRLLSIDD